MKSCIFTSTNNQSFVQGDTCCHPEKKDVYADPSYWMLVLGISKQQSKAIVLGQLKLWQSQSLFL